MTAPVPRPGILDVRPYVGGEFARCPASTASSSSPRTKARWGPVRAPIAAISRADADDYAPLSRRPRRPNCAQALARAHGLDPARIVCGAGSDELLQLLCRRLCRAGRRGAVQPPRLPRLPDRGAGLRARRRSPRPRSEPHCLGRQPAGGGDADDQDRVHRQSQQPDRDLSLGRRIASGSMPACRSTCCWSSIRPMPNSSAPTTTQPGSSWSTPARIR